MFNYSIAGYLVTFSLSSCPTWNSIYIRSQANLYGVEKNITPVVRHRIQGKCGYLCLASSALLRIAVCSARHALLGIVSIYESRQIYAGQKIKARKCGYSEQGIWSRTCGYTELSEVRHSYPECPTPNIDTIRSPASYKILACWNTLKMSGPKAKTPGNFTLFFLRHPWKFHFVFN